MEDLQSKWLCLYSLCGWQIKPDAQLSHRVEIFSVNVSLAERDPEGWIIKDRPLPPKENCLFCVLLRFVGVRKGRESWTDRRGVVRRRRYLWAVEAAGHIPLAPLFNLDTHFNGRCTSEDWNWLGNGEAGVVVVVESWHTVGHAMIHLIRWDSVGSVSKPRREKKTREKWGRQKQLG